MSNHVGIFENVDVVTTRPLPNVSVAAPEPPLLEFLEIRQLSCKKNGFLGHSMDVASVFFLVCPRILFQNQFLQVII